MTFEEFETLDILAWWKEKEAQFPILAAMARDLLTVQASTVASESAFLLVAGYIATEIKTKSRVGGRIIGAGTAGLVVAGLSFAAMALCIHKDLLSPSEFNGTFTDNKLENDNESHLVDTSNGNRAASTAPIQEDLGNVSALDRMPIGMDKTPISPNLPESEVFGSSFAAPNPRASYSNLDIGSPEATSNLSDQINLDKDINEGKLGSEGKGNSDISVDSSSSFSPSSSSANQPVIVNFSFSPDLEPVLETQSKGRTLMRASLLKKNYASAPAHPKNKQSKNDYEAINDSIPVFGSPNPRSSFSPSGIPASSVGSAALQVHPGKVLVPAVVDQVQGQALAALQVLKVSHLQIR
ncbi:Chloroplast thylakoid membrane, putative isoform 2 [Hibiscus syriacus]|uniref:Chloroplast thylakoid membrane, putative isoform 2 n=1 Tax=Hibiscus syriacus TaxID=106335 RepID=A0A6A2YT84_HIBSY|nr:Chloroplast thylakoid membrane, putative isoform 2 [Hibiscus syriacus]